MSCFVASSEVFSRLLVLEPSPEPLPPLAEELRPPLEGPLDLDDDSLEVLPTTPQFRAGPNALQLREVVADCYRLLGRNETAHLVDGIKRIGFRYATQGGMTIAVDDIRVPQGKKGLLEAADQKVADIDAQYQRGLITDDERYARVVEVWREATDDVPGLGVDGMHHIAQRGRDQQCLSIR